MSYFRPAIAKRWKTLVLFGLLSVVIGGFPTVKSTIESTLVEGVAGFIQSDENSTRGRTDENFFQRPTRPIADSDDDPLSRITARVLREINYGHTFAVFAVLTLLGYVLDYAKEKVLMRLKVDAFSDLRSKAFENALRREPSETTAVAYDAGSATAAINKGSDAVVELLGNLLDVLSDLFNILAIVWALSSRDYRFSVFAMLLIAILVAISRLQANRLKASREEYDRTKNRLAGRTDDIITHREIILAFETQDHFTDAIKADAHHYASIDRSLDLAEQRYDLAKNGINELGRIGILFLIVLAAIVMGVAHVAAIGTVYFILSLYQRLYRAAQNVIQNYDRIKRLESTVGTFFQLLPREQHPRTDLADVIAEVRKRYVNFGIAFRDVSLSRNGRAVLKHVSFEVPPAKTLLILGKSGSGKTTIGRMLLGFCPPTTGEIHIGGKPINAEKPGDLRALMSYVAQDQHVVDETVGENLRWALPARTASVSVLTSVLMRVGLIENEADGPRFLAKRAKDLAGGEKQRVAIARALLDDSPIVILDEPLSGADIFTIQKLFPVLVQELKQTSKTVILITHQMCLADLADHAIVLGPGGEVLERGAVTELKRSNGAFGGLYQAARDALGA